MTMHWVEATSALAVPAVLLLGFASSSVLELALLSTSCAASYVVVPTPTGSGLADRLVAQGVPEPSKFGLLTRLCAEAWRPARAETKTKRQHATTRALLPPRKSFMSFSPGMTGVAAVPCPAVPHRAPTAPGV